MAGSRGQGSVAGEPSSSQDPAFLCVGFILRWAVSIRWHRWCLTTPGFCLLPSLVDFFLSSNSSKSLRVEFHGLSLGHVTITEAMAVINLGHVHGSATTAWGGGRKKESFDSKGKRCCLHLGFMGNGTWRGFGRLWGGRLLSGKILLPWQGGSDPHFIRLRK